MPKAARYIIWGSLCLVALFGAYKAYIALAGAYSAYAQRVSEAKERSEHFRYVGNCLNILVYGLKLNPINRHWSLHDETKFGNSWRLYYSLTYPFDDADAERGDGNQPWQTESLQHWDDMIHYLFCAQKIREFPRDQRYANLMAVRGPGSAFEFMDQHGLDELRKVAPNAILLSEVANSNVPWMQVDDLELDTLPRTVNPTNKMDIGSSRGYDQFGVGFADGEVWFLKTSIPFEELAKFLTVDGASEHDRREVLGQYRVPYEELDDH